MRPILLAAFFLSAASFAGDSDCAEILIRYTNSDFSTFPGKENDPSLKAANDDTHQKIERLLPLLHPMDRYVVENHVGWNLSREKSFEEIGLDLGISKPAVYQRFWKAMAFLRDHLADEFP